MGSKRYVLLYKNKEERAKIVLGIPSEENLSKKEYENKLAEFTELLDSINVKLEEDGVEVLYRGVEEV